MVSAIKTEVPLESDDPAYQNFLLQQYEERIEKLSQQDKLSKFCMDAGFLSVVENGQYFVTKDTGALTQFNTVACREYTLPREEAASQPKGVDPREHQNWARCWKLQPVICTVNMELRSELCRGSNKFVMNLNNNEQEIPEDQLEEYAFKTECKRYCMPIEGKSETTKKRTSWLFTENRSH